MVLRRQSKPEGNPYIARGVCADCHMEQDVTVYAASIPEVPSPIECPLCQGEFYPGVVEVFPNPLTAADLSGGFR